MKKKITVQQDLDRHARLASAYAAYIHCTDSATEADLFGAYHSRLDRHWQYCCGGEKSPKHGMVYFDRSPYSSIEVVGSGFVLHNHVTGSQFPFATYGAAAACRGDSSARYTTLEYGRQTA